ncbi:hypothetical protein BT96DRAFT_947241 [Gymnopus androsaceus JB14]|uniref:Protein kinase domain-containing protein n=1 Tax=Gymnopus androsaceus JB14 TaxID=1447944 RepID=A0A6A4GU47_9AGAR|nr:hypothetical protein BT96DRAFT_947241 [Gymnopus androsaceus JB14]
MSTISKASRNLKKTTNNRTSAEAEVCRNARKANQEVEKNAALSLEKTKRIHIIYAALYDEETSIMYIVQEKLPGQRLDRLLETQSLNKDEQCNIGNELKDVFSQLSPLYSLGSMGRLPSENMGLLDANGVKVVKGPLDSLLINLDTTGNFQETWSLVHARLGNLDMEARNALVQFWREDEVNEEAMVDCTDCVRRIIKLFVTWRPGVPSENSTNSFSLIFQGYHLILRLLPSPASDEDSETQAWNLRITKFSSYATLNA